MNDQVVKLEAFEQELEKKLARYQFRYNLTNADVAWMLLRLGTSFHFKDMTITIRDAATPPMVGAMER